MAMKAKTRKDVIEAVLGLTYSSDGKTKGTMIEALAENLNEKWDEIKLRAGKHGGDFKRELTNVIWIWFSGGDTAANAADVIIGEVEAWEETAYPETRKMLERLKEGNARGGRGYVTDLGDILPLLSTELTKRVPLNVFGDPTKLVHGTVEVELKIVFHLDLNDYPWDI